MITLSLSLHLLADFFNVTSLRSDVQVRVLRSGRAGTTGGLVVEEVPDPNADDSVCADFHARRLFPEQLLLLLAQDLPRPGSLSRTPLLLPVLLLLSQELLLARWSSFDRTVLLISEDERSQCQG